MFRGKYHQHGWIFHGYVSFREAIFFAFSLYCPARRKKKSPINGTGEVRYMYRNRCMAGCFFLVKGAKNMKVVQGLDLTTKNVPD